MENSEFHSYSMNEGQPYDGILYFNEQTKCVGINSKYPTYDLDVSGTINTNILD
jgi:hypothetical protein